eukprot:194138_1
MIDIESGMPYTPVNNHTIQTHYTCKRWMIVSLLLIAIPMFWLFTLINDNYIINIQYTNNQTKNRHLLTANYDYSHLGSPIQEALLNERGHLKQWIISHSLLNENHIKQIKSFSDIHGAYDQMIKMLVENGLITEDTHKWKATDTILIFGGDSIDRGPKSIETIKYLKKLYINVTQTPNTFNSLVLINAGNHEHYYLKEIPDQQDYSWWLNNNCIPGTPREFKQNRPDLSKYQNMNEWFSVEGDIGKWLRPASNIALLLDDKLLFVHAGFTKGFVKRLKANGIKNLNTLNEKFRTALTEPTLASEKIIKHLLTKFEQDEDHPLWTRKYITLDIMQDMIRMIKNLTERNDNHANALNQERIDYLQHQPGCDELDYIKDYLNIPDIIQIIGHNKDAMNVEEFCEGRLVKTDIHIHQKHNIAPDDRWKWMIGNEKKMFTYSVPPPIQASTIPNYSSTSKCVLAAPLANDNVQLIAEGYLKKLGDTMISGGWKDRFFQLWVYSDDISKKVWLVYYEVTDHMHYKIKGCIYIGDNKPQFHVFPRKSEWHMKVSRWWKLKTPHDGDRKKRGIMLLRSVVKETGSTDIIYT